LGVQVRVNKKSKKKEKKKKKRNEQPAAASRLGLLTAEKSASR
jgi:hypothetical protein